MFRKILVLAFLGLLVSCGSSRSHIQTSKDRAAKTTKSRKTKPAIKTTTDTRKSTASSSSGSRTTETLEATSRTTVYADVVKAYVLQYKEDVGILRKPAFMN